MEDKKLKSGFVAVLGRPNVGKSTLINALTGQKVAIVSPKPQTTRSNMVAIDNGDGYQIIFTDTPGVHRPRTRLGEFMNDSALKAAGDVDCAVLVVEAGRDVYDIEKELITGLKEKKIPVVLVINKVDTVSREALLPQISAFAELTDFAAVVPISARRREVSDVRKEILALLPEGPMYYPDDIAADRSLRDMCAEIIREKILRLLDREVPHGTAVEIEKMEEGEELTRISAVIYCEKSSHKPIIIGKGG
ncbi:MAG: GTPase Era, partial [Oscillospiraceae bacterium]|nr:GTPase Era [Oscillospiraceae bacterium]